MIMFFFKLVLFNSIVYNFEGQFFIQALFVSLHNYFLNLPVRQLNL